jgi:hypothetical protein
VEKTDALVDAAGKGAEYDDLDAFRRFGQGLDLLYDLAEVGAVLVVIFGDLNIAVRVVFLHVWSERIKIAVDQVWQLSSFSIELRH